MQPVMKAMLPIQTDAQLIWKCCQKIFNLIQRIRKQLKLRRSSINHDKHKKDYLSYAKRKKKSKKASKKLLFLYA